MSVSQSPFLRVTHGLTMVSAYMSALAILAATLIAATFLGAPYGLKQNAHINIDIFVVWLPGKRIL